ncbi:hypothetical protein KUCAC02_028081, partial [Chaenocephalus aceratus]
GRDDDETLEIGNSAYGGRPLGVRLLLEALTSAFSAHLIASPKPRQHKSKAVLLRLQSTKNHQTDPQTYPENRKWVLTEAESGYVMEIR